jgi:hypothetical protein
MIGTKGSSPATSSRFANEAVGRNGFSKRNHIQLRASPPRPVNWTKYTKQFLLGLLAVTSLLMLCTRLLLYFTFLSSRHGAMLEEQTSSDLLFKTEEYIMRSNGISGLAVDIETTRQIITDRNDVKIETAVDEGTTVRSPDGVAFLHELTLNLTGAGSRFSSPPQTPPLKNHQNALQQLIGFPEFYNLKISPLGWNVLVKSSWMQRKLRNVS